MHRGLKIRQGFLAKHIFGFAEHKALEKSRVCQSRRATARFAEPPLYLLRLKAGISGQELKSTRGPHQLGAGPFLESGKHLDPPLVHSLSAPRTAASPRPQLSILLLSEVHHRSAFLYHPKEFKWRRKEFVNSEPPRTFSSSSSPAPSSTHPVSSDSGSVARACSLNLQMFCTPRPFLASTPRLGC